MNQVSTVPPVDSKQTRFRLEFLDGVRGVAALYVVLHHLFLQIWPLDLGVSPTGSDKLLTDWLVYGRFAVDVFIVLSGFSLALPVVRGDGWLRGGVKTFFLRRVWRILPPYYLALGLSLLLIGTVIGDKTGTHWDISVPVTWNDFWSKILLLQDIDQKNSGSINHVFWSVAAEWHIYFLFPLLLLIQRRVGPMMTTVLFIAVSYVGNVMLKHFFAISVPLHLLGLFAMGVLGANVVYAPFLSRLKERVPWMVLAAACTALTLLHCWRSGFVLYLPNAMLVDILVGIGATALLIHLTNVPSGRWARFLSWKPFLFLGTMGYSLYLVHAPLLQLVTKYLVLPLHLSRWESFLVQLMYLPLVIAGCYAFFWCCERPFLRLQTQKKVTLAQAAVAEPAP